KNYVARHLEAGESRDAKVDEVLRIGTGVAGRHDACAADFTHLDVRQPHDQGLADQGMLSEQFLDFAGHDHLTAASVSLLQPPGQRQVSVGCDHTDVSGAKPAVSGKGRSSFL